MKARFVALFFFVGLVVGLVTSSLIKHNSGEPDSPPAQPVGNTGLEDRDAREQALHERLVSKDAEIAKLRAELSKALEQPESPSVDESQRAAFEEERSEQIRQRFEERMDQRIDGRVARMARQYGLSEAQQAALREIYAKRMENQRARRNGEDVERFDMDAALSTVLTGDQFSAYLEETQEDIYNRAELVATTQTVRLSQVMDLSPEIENMIYEALNVTTQEMMIAQEEGEDFNMRKVTEERLGSFLTEEQMKIVNENLRGPGGGWMRGGPRP